MTGPGSLWSFSHSTAARAADYRLTSDRYDIGCFPAVLRDFGKPHLLAGSDSILLHLALATQLADFLVLRLTAKDASRGRLGLLRGCIPDGQLQARGAGRKDSGLSHFPSRPIIPLVI